MIYSLMQVNVCFIYYHCVGLLKRSMSMIYSLMQVNVYVFCMLFTVRGFWVFRLSKVSACTVHAIRFWVCSEKVSDHWYIWPDILTSCCPGR